MTRGSLDLLRHHPHFETTNHHHPFQPSNADSQLSAVRVFLSLKIKVHPVQSPFPDAIKGYKPLRRLRRDAILEWLS